eukprot:1426518-Rhodomonas_salina.1
MPAAKDAFSCASEVALQNEDPGGSTPVSDSTSIESSKDLPPSIPKIRRTLMPVTSQEHEDTTHGKVLAPVEPEEVEPAGDDSNGPTLRHQVAVVAMTLTAGPAVMLLMHVAMRGCWTTWPAGDDSGSGASYCPAGTEAFQKPLFCTWVACLGQLLCLAVSHCTSSTKPDGSNASPDAVGAAPQHSPIATVTPANLKRSGSRSPLSQLRLFRTPSWSDSDSDSQLEDPADFNQAENRRVLCLGRCCGYELVDETAQGKLHTRHKT